jgi:TonB family protein
MALSLAVVAQESVPVPLHGKGKARICCGKESDAADCVVGPKGIYTPDPTYPVKEHDAGHEGTVLLLLVVGSDGLTRDVRVSRSLSPEFDRAAMDAVNQWKFIPATMNDKRVSVEIDVQVTFKHR